MASAYDAIGHLQVTWRLPDMFKLIYLGTLPPAPPPLDLLRFVHYVTHTSVEKWTFGIRLSCCNKFTSELKSLPVYIFKEQKSKASKLSEKSRKHACMYVGDKIYSLVLSLTPVVIGDTNLSLDCIRENMKKYFEITIVILFLSSKWCYTFRFGGRWFHGGCTLQTGYGSSASAPKLLHY